jgi:hypothetical protein
LSSIAISPSNQPDNTVKDIIDGSASAPGPDDHDSTNNILEAKREESSSRLVGLGRILRPHKMRKTTLNADDITQMDVTYPDLGICHRIPSPPAESSCYMSDTTGFAISPDSPDPNGDTVFNSMHETSGSVILSPRMNRPKSAKSLVPTKPGSKLWLPDSKWENITVSENKFTSAKFLIGNVPEKRRFGCRNGPISPELAKRASAMRACWPCRMVKEKVSFSAYGLRNEELTRIIV